MSSRSVTLGEVADLIRGVTFEPEDLVPVGSGGSVVCFRTANVQEDLDESDLIALPGSAIRRNEQHVQEGDILVSSANSWNLVGKCAAVPTLSYQAVAGGFISILRANADVVDQRFLYRWLSAGPTQHLVRRLARQTTSIANLPIDRFLDLPLSLPPLVHQRRIAAVLDKADGIRRKRRESLSLLDELLRSAFLEMFGDPSRNDKGWETVTGGEVFSELRYGTSAKCSPVPSPESHPVLRIPNITGGEVSWSDLKYANLQSAETQKLRLSKGDVLFVRTNGNPENIGRCAVFDGSRPALFASYLIRGRIAAESAYRPQFLRHVVSYPSYRARLVAETRTTAGNYNISISGLERLLFICPPLALQDKFLGLAAVVAELRGQMNGALAESELLCESLAQRAFAPGKGRS